MTTETQPDPDPGRDANSDGEGNPVPGGAHRRWRWMWMLPALAVVLLLVAAALGGLLYRQRHEQDHRAAVVAAAKQVLINAYTIDYTSVTHDYARFMAGTTDKLHSQLQEGKSKFVSTVKQTQTQEKGIVQDAGLVRFDGDTATVAIALDSPLRTKQSSKPQTRRFRTDVDMRRVGSRWLATDIRQVD